MMDIKGRPISEDKFEVSDRHDCTDIKNMKEGVMMSKAGVKFS